MSVDMDASFSNAELAEILGRSSRFIIDWSERGLIEADIVPATGPGSRRRYSYQAVLRASLGLHLKERYGMSRHIVKDILDKLSLFGFFKDWNIGFVKSQKDYYEEGLSKIFAENPKGIPEFLEPLVRNYREMASNPPPLKNSGCLAFFFLKDDYTWFVHPLATLKETVPHLGSKIEGVEKNGKIVTDALIVDLAAIKNTIDQRIAAIT